jgi:dipeptidyl aminopeptidase/acylaminoacyl peptidase
MILRSFPFVFVVVLVAILATPTISQNNLFTPEKLWELGRVSMMDISPNDSLVLYGVTYYDVAKNKGNRDLYLVRTDGGSQGKPIQLTDTPQSEYNAQYRPDGKKIGYLKGGKLWEMNPDGTDQRQISEMAMNGFKYSPDGSKILFIQDVKYDPTTQDVYPDLPQASGRIIDDLMYRHWDQWHDYSYSNIFVVSYAESQLLGQPLNIMGEAFDSPVAPFGGMEEISWSPNSDMIAYTCKKEKGIDFAQSTDTDIYLYSLQTGTTTNLTEGMQGYDREPVFSPTGRYLAWNSMQTPGYEADRNRVFIHDFQKDSKWEMTTSLDQNANHPRWSEDERKIFFQTEYLGTRQIWEVNFDKNGRLRPLTNGNNDYYDFFVTPTQLIARRASMSQPHEIFRITRDAAQARQITFTNKPLLDSLDFGKVRKRIVNTTDGEKMVTWVIYPPGFDESKSYPTLLYCQGGPQSTVSQFWSYRWNFQLMAANGYIVVAPNRRGLPSFGQKWNRAISGDWGGQAMQDLLSAIDDVKQEPYVDSTRLGAVGASYGGYSVYWLAGNHEKRFKTFISHAGLFNLESWYGTTEELFFANHDLGGPYWQPLVPETYRLDSPHLYVDNWDTPILVIHGELDFRVPVSEGMQAFQAARIKGLESRFLYFPDEGHWVLQPQNGLLWHRVFFEWLDRYLK